MIFSEIVIVVRVCLSICYILHCYLTTSNAHLYICCPMSSHNESNIWQFLSFLEINVEKRTIPII